MKFDKLRRVISEIKSVFRTFSGDLSGISLDGLQKAMVLLHGDVTKQEVMELFDFVDIDDSKLIDLKEFLVALCVGYILEVIPAFSTKEDSSSYTFSSNQPSQRNTDAENFSPVLVEDVPSEQRKPQRTVSGFMGKGNEVREMLNLIVTAYLLFDPEAQGYIEKTAVEKLLEEDGHKQGKNALLSEQKWKEMVKLAYTAFILDTNASQSSFSLKLITSLLYL